MKLKKFLNIFFILMLVAISVEQSGACTIVAVSGKVTADGRPLLFKNRDSSSNDIQIKVADGNCYSYLCQCKVPDGQALSGFNETGFAIINSYSYNVKNSIGNRNGYIMQLALENCASVDDFENLLKQFSQSIPAISNFGVMDAKGNVAIFETGQYTYTRYDASDDSKGYIVRTNFSMSGDMTKIDKLTPTSWPRYNTASIYLEQIIQNQKLSKEHFLTLSRYLVTDDGSDLYDQAPYDEDDGTMVKFENFIPRDQTTSAMVIQGIKNEESPMHTIAWTTVGPPITTVTIPFWITPSKTLPTKAIHGADGHAWLCQNGLRLKDNIFSNGETIRLALLYNQKGTGIMQKIIRIESEILQQGNELADKIRLNNSAIDDISTYYSWVDNYIEQQYNEANLCDNRRSTEIRSTRALSIVDDTSYDILGRTIDKSKYSFGITIRNKKKYLKNSY